MTRLRQVDSSIDDIIRRRSGRGFSYHNPGGWRVDNATVARIRELAMLKRHGGVAGDMLRFDYPAKGSIWWAQVLDFLGGREHRLAPPA